MDAKNNKGVELTLNTIIIAAILLIAFVVIVAIFSGSATRLFHQIFQTASCENLFNARGQCYSSHPGEEAYSCIMPYASCVDSGKGEYCCWPK